MQDEDPPLNAHTYYKESSGSMCEYCQDWGTLLQTKQLAVSSLCTYLFKPISNVQVLPGNLRAFGCRRDYYSLVFLAFGLLRHGRAALSHLFWNYGYPRDLLWLLKSQCKWHASLVRQMGNWLCSFYCCCSLGSAGHGHSEVLILSVSLVTVMSSAPYWPGRICEKETFLIVGQIQHMAITKMQNMIKRAIC